MWLIITFYLSICGTYCYGGHFVKNLGNGSTAGRLHIGFLWPKNMIGHSVSVALKIGLKKTKQSLPGYEIDYKMEDSMCNPKVGIKAVVNLQKKYKRLDAIIGSQCSVVCEPVGLLATIWNIPQVSSRCSSILLSDKILYPTFSRPRGNNLHTSRVVMNVLQAFGWQRFSIISSDDSFFKLAAEYLLKFSEEHNMDVQVFTFSATNIDKNADKEKLHRLRSLIHTMKETARVTILFMFRRDFRNFLIFAKQEGYLNKGCVLIGLDTAYRGSVAVLRDIEPQITDTEIYQGLIGVTEDDGPITEQWEKFRMKHYLIIHQVTSANKKLKWLSEVMNPFQVGQGNFMQFVQTSQISVKATQQQEQKIFFLGKNTKCQDKAAEVFISSSQR